MPDKTRELMAMAAECRALAERAITETVREQLLEMATQFERLAEHRLKTRQPMPVH
jgi:hypothetical protein